MQNMLEIAQRSHDGNIKVKVNTVIFIIVCMNKFL